MANTFLVLIVGFMAFTAGATAPRFLTEVYLGEKNLSSYSDRYDPFLKHDSYRGRLSFKDESFFQQYFQKYSFSPESDYASFLFSELPAGMLCPDATLSKHFEFLRYSYRLVTLSYLLEGQWHMNLMSTQLNQRNGCQFDLALWLKKCRPHGAEMKKYITRLTDYLPAYKEKLPADYNSNNWLKEFKSGKWKWYSHYRIAEICGKNCSPETLGNQFQSACESDEHLMTLICSEEDHVYGLSKNRDAYFLLGQSSIVNSFESEAQALGCLQRFSETLSHREAHYRVLDKLFPVLRTFLKETHQERYTQGRSFFFGAGQEYEKKGVKDIYYKDQPLKVAKLPPLEQANDEKVVPQVPTAETPRPSVPGPAPKVPAPEVAARKEIHKVQKSAFLLASELRKQSKLPHVEVDMVKLKYDYIFSLYMLNTLSEKLEVFMTREALKEMVTYDKLGTKEGPVPLLFLKYLIDTDEHRGLWNILSVVGEQFYVANEIDVSFNPEVEYVRLTNSEDTNHQWQLSILAPH
jgi:hypothetical protein